MYVIHNCEGLISTAQQCGCIGCPCSTVCASIQNSCFHHNHFYAMSGITGSDSEILWPCLCTWYMISQRSEMKFTKLAPLPLLWKYSVRFYRTKIKATGSWILKFCDCYVCILFQYLRNGCWPNFHHKYDIWSSGSGYILEVRGQRSRSQGHTLKQCLCI